MKYIRLFEELEPIKKYFIFNSTFEYIIFEYIKEDRNAPSGNDITIKSLYLYKKYQKELVLINHDQITYSESYLRSRIVYESNDLQDCVETIKMLDDVKKYNL